MLFVSLQYRENIVSARKVHNTALEINQRNIFKKLKQHYSVKTHFILLVQENHINNQCFPVFYEVTESNFQPSSIRIDNGVL